MTWTNPPPKLPSTDRQPNRRVFLWIFLTVQVLFLLILAFGARTGARAPTDCGTLNMQDCNDAQNIATTLGVGFLVVIWGTVDIILGITYGIYRLASRR